MYNLSIICKTADSLRKSGYTLSQAFKMAWKLAKGTAVTKVAGVSLEQRQKAIEHLRRYSPDTVRVSLTREAGNIYDKNAIAVYASVNSGKAYKMGYILVLYGCESMPTDFFKISMTSSF